MNKFILIVSVLLCSMSTAFPLRMLALNVKYSIVYGDWLTTISCGLIFCSVAFFSAFLGISIVKDNWQEEDPNKWILF